MERQIPQWNLWVNIEILINQMSPWFQVLYQRIILPILQCPLTVVYTFLLFANKVIQAFLLGLFKSS